MIVVAVENVLWDTIVHRQACLARLISALQVPWQPMRSVSYVFRPVW